MNSYRFSKLRDLIGRWLVLIHVGMKAWLNVCLYFTCVDKYGDGKSLQLAHTPSKRNFAKAIRKKN